MGHCQCHNAVIWCYHCSVILAVEKKQQMNIQCHINEALSQFICLYSFEA